MRESRVIQLIISSEKKLKNVCVCICVHICVCVCLCVLCEYKHTKYSKLGVIAASVQSGVWPPGLAVNFSQTELKPAVTAGRHRGSKWDCLLLVTAGTHTSSTGSGSSMDRGRSDSPPIVILASFLEVVAEFDWNLLQDTQGEGNLNCLLPTDNWLWFWFKSSTMSLLGQESEPAMSEAELFCVAL